MEARMDRELVQIEKLMEERAAKKSRGESLALGNKPKGGGRDRDRRLSDLGLDSHVSPQAPNCSAARCLQRQVRPLAV